LPLPEGGFQFLLEAAAYYTPPELPDDAALLAGLEPLNGSTVILCYPFRRSELTRQLVAIPDSDVVVIFGLLRFAAPDPALVQSLLEQNRALFEIARAQGGKRYPIGSVAFSPADWAEHFGACFPALVALKGRFDPNGVLAPGQQIFQRGDSP